MVGVEEMSVASTVRLSTSWGKMSVDGCSATLPNCDRKVVKDDSCGRVSK